MKESHNFTKKELRNRDINYLQPNRFKVVLDNLVLPNVDFTITEIELPDISVPPVTISGGVSKLELYEPADSVKYSDLNFTFLVDEDLKNYTELHNWMLGTTTNPDYVEDGKEKSMSLLINSSHGNVVRKITFNNCKPTALSAIPFNSGNTGTEASTCSVTMSYTSFIIE